MGHPGTHTTTETAAEPLHNATGNILVITILLLALGLVMAASTAPVSNPALARFVVLRHTLWLGLSMVAMLVAYSVDYHSLRRFSVVILAVAMAGLVGVLWFGAVVNGARRWYRIGNFLSFQPSEAYKVALCLYMADFLAREQERIKSFLKGFLQPIVVMGAGFVLILRQPDFGTALLIAVVTFAMMFVAGIRISHVVAALTGSVPLLVYAVAVVPYRLRRILTFLNPWADPQGAGYQIIQSLIALGSGGWVGVGLGNGRQKLLYLPEAGSDFVFAIIGEELGLVGCAVVILLFALLLWQGLKVARHAPDLFGSLLAFGLTFSICLQAGVNIAVVTCSAPTKGLALPLISSGGSSLMATTVAIGLLMNIASHAETEPAPEARGAVKVRRASS